MASTPSKAKGCLRARRGPEDEAKARYKQRGWIEWTFARLRATARGLQPAPNGSLPAPPTAERPAPTLPASRSENESTKPGSRWRRRSAPSRLVDDVLPLLSLLLGDAIASTPLPAVEPGDRRPSLYPPPARCDRDAALPTDGWIVLAARDPALAEAARRHAELRAGRRQIPLVAEEMCRGDASRMESRPHLIALRPSEPLPAGAEVALEIPGFAGSLAAETCSTHPGKRTDDAMSARRDASAAPSWRVGEGPAGARTWWSGPPALVQRQQSLPEDPVLFLTLPLRADPAWYQVDWRAADGHELSTFGRLTDPGLVVVGADGCGGEPMSEVVYDLTVSVYDRAGQRHPAPGPNLRVKLLPHTRRWIPVPPEEPAAAAPTPDAVAEESAPAPPAEEPRAAGCGCAAGEASPGVGGLLALLPYLPWTRRGRRRHGRAVRASAAPDARAASSGPRALGLYF